MSLIALATYAAITTQGFLTVTNLKAVLTASALVGIVGVGMTMLILSGNLFSLSLGMTAAVGSILFLYAVQWGVGLAIALALVLGAAICSVQGAIIGGWGANPIIVTIGAGAIQQGFTLWVTGGGSVIPSDSGNYQFLNRPVFGVPFAVYVLAATVVAGEVVLRRTRFGSEIYVLGENRAAARAAALPIPRLVIGVFAVAGVCAGLAGVLLGAQFGHGELLVEGSLTFDALAAALVGGSAITGGRGSTLRTALGAVAIAAIANMLLLRGYGQGAQLLVKGLIVTGVVVVVQLDTKRTTA